MAAKEKVEMLAGREIVIPEKGEAYWKDDGVIVSADEIRFLREIDAGADGLDAKKAGEKQNPDLLFYKYEAALEAGKRPEPNPIRGFVLSIFERPAWIQRDDDENEGRDDSANRLRIAAFILLTKPCIVGMRGKRVRVANIGEKVWMDLNHATRGIVGIARPRFNQETGAITALAEIMWIPSHKESFQTIDPRTKKPVTWNAWRGDLFGGYFAGNGFKSFQGEEKVAKVFGNHRAAPPSIITEEKAAELLGLKMPNDVIDMPALPEGSGTSHPQALPASTAPRNN